MRELDIPSKAPTGAQMKELKSEAQLVLSRLRADECELPLPVFFEFAGSPKSGKSTIIGIVSHFLKRVGFDVVAPAEGASLRTPVALRDDWLAFNTWSGMYALRHILEACHESHPVDIVILDRGLFDAAAWMEFLCSEPSRITQDDRDRITGFLTLDLWRRRELGVFLFTADHATSLVRESESKLIDEPGSVMNEAILSGLIRAYDTVADGLEEQFDVFHLDTSFRDRQLPSFQAIAYKVAGKMVEIVNRLTNQLLLVTERVEHEGFVTNRKHVDSVVAAILKDGSPRFAQRSDAEKSNILQQIVPYALIRNADGAYFVARRRADHSRDALAGKRTILVGGHAEQIDWNPKHPDSVFDACLRRELDEELIGLRITDVERLGIIADNRTAVGSKHLAILFRVAVGGAPKVRRQASDQEFGRESVSWRSEEEIREDVQNLDPWSQLVAEGLFGAKLPTLQDEPTLFTKNNRG